MQLRNSRHPPPATAAPHHARIQDYVTVANKRVLKCWSLCARGHARDETRRSRLFLVLPVPRPPHVRRGRAHGGGLCVACSGAACDHLACLKFLLSFHHDAPLLSGLKCRYDKLPVAYRCNEDALIPPQA